MKCPICGDNIGLGEKFCTGCRADMVAFGEVSGDKVIYNQSPEEQMAIGNDERDVIIPENYMTAAGDDTATIMLEPMPSSFVQPEQIDFTMYTFVTMLVTLFSVAFGVVTMVLNGKPVHYFLQNMVGDAINDYSYEMAELILYESVASSKVNGMFLGLAALGICTAVISIIGLVRAMNQYAKPMIIPNVVGLIVSLGALALYFYIDNFMNVKMSEIVKVDGELESVFGVYSLIIILAVCNVVAMGFAIVAAISGLKTWKETGKTCK